MLTRITIQRNKMKIVFLYPAVFVCAHFIQWLLVALFFIIFMLCLVLSSEFILFIYLFFFSLNFCSAFVFSVGCLHFNTLYSIIHLNSVHLSTSFGIGIHTKGSNTWQPNSLFFICTNTKQFNLFHCLS